VRVLFYIDSPEWTGSARAFVAAARGLSERGHTVTVACRPESALEQRLEFGAYEVVSLPTGPAGARMLRATVQERFVQVMFVQTEREQLAAATAARLAERAAVLRRVPAGSPLSLGARGRLALRLCATGFLFTSPDELARATKPSRARLAPSVVPLGVNAHLYDAVRPASRASIGAGGGTRLLVCVFDHTSRARAANVLRVVALLAPRHPELQLAFIGPGSDDHDLRMHAAALHITRQVSFLGERDDYLSVLGVADLGWVVADGDNGVFGVLDLLASRVPVLAERGTIAQQFVPDGIVGLVLPPADPPNTAAAVTRMLAHDEQRGVMGSAGRARVARTHSEAAMVDAFEQAATVASERSQW
jgi:glycosyltransferase involved in cell wall biosynthesis